MKQPQSKRTIRRAARRLAAAMQDASAPLKIRRRAANRLADMLDATPSRPVTTGVE